MTLSLQLELARRDLRVQENALCRFVVSNRGVHPVHAVHPEFGSHQPRLRLLDLRTGAEYRFARQGESLLPDVEGDLAPGARWEASLSLLDHVSFPGEGAFELSALYENDGEEYESPSVPVEIRGATARNLCVDGSHRHATWVDVAGPAPEIMWSRIDLERPGGISDVAAIAPASFHARPILSQGPNRTGCLKPWIAWIDGKKLNCVPPNGSTQQLELGGEEAELAQPFFAEPTHASGVLFVSGRLEVVRFDAGETGRRVAQDLVGARPRWMASHADSKGRRVATFLQPSSDGISLCKANWSETKLDRPEPLAMWKGLFLAAGTALSREDEIRGATVLCPEGLPVCVEWTIDETGEFRERDCRTIGWWPSEPISEARVRIGEDGSTAVVLRDPQGTWWMDRGGRKMGVPEPARRTRLPLEILFLANGEPVLLCAQERRGLQILEMNGTRLA